MATFEERELVDYTIKKILEAVRSEDFVVKDLDKMYNRIDRIEYKMKKIVDRIERIENRISSLERSRYFNRDGSGSSDSE